MSRQKAHILITVLLLTLAATAGAQQDSVVVRPRKENPGFERPVFQGFSAHIDLLTPVLNLIHGQVYGGEVHLDVNLFARVFPTIEVGYADVNKTLAPNNHYHAQAPYIRLGLNFGYLSPITKRGTRRSLDCYPYIGLRYAMGFVNYRISGLDVSDDYWGSSTTAAYGQPLVYAGWIEVVAGVRMNLYRGLTMGWAFRFRGFIHTSAKDKAYLWYVPGYGKADGSAFTFNYTIGYTFKTRHVRRIEESRL